MALSKKVRDEMVAVEDSLLDSIDHAIEFWGFKGVHGRVWGILYLSPEPMTMEEIQERLGLSSGAVSMTLKELRSWGIVYKVREKRERKALYRAETNFGKMITRILDDREKRIVDNTTDNIRSAISDFRGMSENVRGKDAAELNHKIERARQLEMLGVAVLAILESITKLRRVDDALLEQVTKLPSRIIDLSDGQLKKLTGIWKSSINRLVS